MNYASALWVVEIRVERPGHDDSFGVTLIAGG
jgi:hypothetical protein